MKEVSIHHGLLCLLVIDECSLLSFNILGAIDTQLRNLRQRSKQKFGGVNVLLTGDFFQNGPIAELGFCSENLPKNGDGLLGCALWRTHLSEVFYFTENFRQKDDRKHLEVVRNIRKSNVSNEDIKLMNEETLINSNRKMPCPLVAPYVPIIVSKNSERHTIEDIAYKEVSKATKLILLNAKFQSINSLTILSKQQEQGLYRLRDHHCDFMSPNLLVYIGMPVLVTKNQIKSNYGGILSNYILNLIGIANGTRGVIRSIVYDRPVTYKNEGIRIYCKTRVVSIPKYTDDIRKTATPKAILIKLFVPDQMDLRKKVKISGLENDIFPVMIQTETTEVQGLNRKFKVKITQFPIIPGIAFTNHKFQGQTATHGVSILSSGNKKWLYTA